MRGRDYLLYTQSNTSLLTRAHNLISDRQVKMSISPDWFRTIPFRAPETGIRWHREGFKFFWTTLSRRMRIGRPSVNAKVRSFYAEPKAKQSI